MSVFVVRVVSHLFAECVNVNYFYLSFTIIAAFSLLSLKSSSQLIQSKMIDNLQLLSLSILLQPGRNCEHELTCASLLKPETISRCQFRKRPWILLGGFYFKFHGDSNKDLRFLCINIT